MPPIRALLRSSAPALIGWGLVALGAALGAGGGCSSDDAATTGYDGGVITTGVGGDGGGGGSGPTSRAKFDAIEMELVGACGACHQAQGAADAPFLGEPDRYASITSWPGIIAPDPEESILVTHPADPSHGAGEAPDMPEDLRPLVIEWLAAEAKELPSEDKDGGTRLPPFKPFVAGAFNTIYLDPLGDLYKNMSISFNAEELGGTADEPSLLSITNITVHPVGTTQLHIVHPLFTVYAPDSSPDPDPVDSFSNIDQTFSLQTSLQLGTGAVVLTNWKKDAYLGIAFEIIEIYGIGQDAGLIECNDVALFKQKVVPRMQYCATTCHGGTNEDAKATMDLSKLNDATPTDACIQVRARITPGDPGNSQILIVTDPSQQAVHMYKFMGSVSNYNAFKDEVSPWILAEE